MGYEPNVIIETVGFAAMVSFFVALVSILTVKEKGAAALWAVAFAVIFWICASIDDTVVGIGGL